MTLIQWNDNYSVNVAEIDDQHKEIIRLINKLFDSRTYRAGKETTGNILKSLTDYITTHFKTEEAYFAQLGYSESSSHKQEHQAFVQKVSKYKKSFDKNTANLSLELRKFLINWLMNHILISDKKYTTFFNSNGLR